MDKRNSLTATLLVLAGLAFNSSSGPPARSSPTGAGSQKVAATTNHGKIAKSNDNAPWDTLGQFLKERNAAKSTQDDPEFLIVMLPDPVDTHLSLLFDREIESVQNAASALDYTFDRYWIPWRDNPYNVTDKPAVRDEQEAQRREREEQPGLLLFRRPEPQKEGRRDLIIFLVGETPTAGIQASEFEKAVAYIRERRVNGKIVEKFAPGPRGLTIPVLGPTFSGSFPSLASAIGQNTSFQVVSGSTTSTVSQAEFKKRVPSFQTTLHADNFASCTFLFRIAEESTGPFSSPTSVAILSEGDTSYGEGFRDDGVGLAYGEGSEIDKTNANACNVPSVRVFRFSFPRDIARLRNAYHEDFLAAPVPDAYKSLPREGVSLTLKDPNDGHDNVPNFSREHTPLSQEAVLLNLAAALRRDGVRYAAIAATDPLDTFFLARFLAANTPDIRLYQLDADLLFVRPPESLPLTGMLSITTYPLILRNQEWIHPITQDLKAFASRYSEGIYNATLFLLNGSHRMLDYGSPWGGAKSVPPLWLTASGRNGYWPVAVLTEKPEPDEPLELLVSNSLVGDPTSEPPSLLYILLVCLSVALSAWMSIAFWKSVSSHARWVSEFKTTAPATTERIPYILIFTFALALIALGLAGPPLRLFLSPHAPFAKLLFLLLTCGGSLIFVGLAVCLTMKRASNRVTLAAWFLFGLIALVGGFLLLTQERGEGYFLAYRSLNLSSGLSPYVPLMLLFAAYAAWGRLHWQRIILVEERRQKLPALGGTVPGASLSPAAQAIENTLQYVSIHPKLLVTAVAASLVALVIGRPHLRSFEHWTFDWLYLGVLAVLFGLLVLTGAQFVVVWIRLERLLELTELHPIRFALNDLPPDRTWSPIWQSNLRKRSHVLLSRSVDCLRLLAGHDPYLSVPLSKLTNATQLVTRRVAQGERESAEQIRAMELSVEISEYLAQVLEDSYWQKGSSQSTSQTAPPDDDRWAKLAAEFVALRILAYIRYVMLHLRNLLGFLTTGFILGVISLSSYPFQSPQMISALQLAVFAALAGIVGWVFVRMNGSALLRRVTTGPGEKRDFSFWIRIVETGALPVLAILASNVPGAGQFLFSWLGPLLDRLH